MATFVSELEAAKKNLSEALGDNVKQYWANLKLWFKQKISKEEFDLEAHRLLTQDNVHSHNDFLLAILTRCQILVSTPEGAGSLPWTGALQPSLENPRARKSFLLFVKNLIIGSSLRTPSLELSSSWQRSPRVMTT